MSSIYYAAQSDLDRNPQFSRRWTEAPLPVASPARGHGDLRPIADVLAGMGRRLGAHSMVGRVLLSEHNGANAVAANE